MKLRRPLAVNHLTVSFGINCAAKYLYVSGNA